MKTNSRLTPPSREEVRALISAIEYGRTGRAGFAVTAIYCLINEGISPVTTGTLRYRNFNFGRRWVEFTPRKGTLAVRRPLSEETANHLRAQFWAFKSKPEDLIHRATGRSSWNEAIASEIVLAGFDPQLFSVKRLRWLWLDAHPSLREDEIRAGAVGAFILRWAKKHHQEALFRICYEQNGLLRPSWSFPMYDEVPPAAPNSGEADQGKNSVPDGD